MKFRFDFIPFATIPYYAEMENKSGQIKLVIRTFPALGLTSMSPPFPPPPALKTFLSYQFENRSEATYCSS